MSFKYSLSAEALAEKLVDFKNFENVRTAVRVAGTPSEMKAAYRLVYQEYLKRRYCPPSAKEMQYTFHCFLPDSRTFLLENSSKLLGTLTLLPDSSCGLPIESAFQEEIRQIRVGGSRIAEIGLLAFDPELYGMRKSTLSSFRNWSSIFPLFKAMFQYAIQAGVMDLVIAVLPEHEKLYQALSFETVGSTRPYPLACQDRAVAMHLNVLTYLEKVPAEHAAKTYFLNEAQPVEYSRLRVKWSADSVREMLHDKPIPAAIGEYFKVLYPGF